MLNKTMYIRANNLLKNYYTSTVDVALSLGRVLLGKVATVQTSSKVIEAVNDVSLEIHEGERVGIIGRNGAGKTTLLQMLAGLTNPTSGSLEVQGQVSCVMTLGVGFRGDLTGRENIYLDGETNHKTREEVDKFIDDIIAFADIGEFIDQPLRTYSSGMKARLAFSMITYIDPEILIIDEALSVGDASFAKKSSNRIKEICEAGKIVIIVSHGMQSIEDMCKRCLWMDRGRIVMDGDPKTVTKAYLEAVRKDDEAEIQERFRKRIGEKAFSPGFSIDAIDFIDNKGQTRLIFNVGDDLTLRIKVNSAQRLARPDLRIFIERTDGILMLQNTASEDGFDCGEFEGEEVFKIEFGKILFGKGMYEVTVELLDQGQDGEPEIISQISRMLRIDNPDYRFIQPAFWAPFEYSVGTVRGDQ